ncbi:MAG: asparagine synthase (glutamine-hydrolyzing) [Defluviitaleaceae bacterium]|nr:asparagine synthase (glutamine-hydrolyzing) [Defluviitaleaceae bacterium]
MSGIGGIAGYGADAPAAAQVCDEMLTALKGRGADVHGTFISQEVCVIHTGYSRLEGGKQPLRSSLGNKAYVLVYDGELYNKDELHKELVEKGYRFTDTSDAAIILNGYMAWGQSVAERMNGVFSLALWDGTGLFLARDRLGLRPLFYSVGSYGLVFASTIKAVLAHPRVLPVIDAEGAAEILLIGPGRTPGSGVFKGVNELLPGECGTYTPGGGMKLHTYWRLEAATHPDDFKETVQNVRSLFVDAVKLQSTVKNTRVATLLSGGLDSSAVAALSKSRESFSVDFVGNDKHFTPTAYQTESDGAYISRMVSFLSLRHKGILLGTDEIVNALPDAMKARGFPGMADVDSSFLMFLKKISKDVPIALSGEGADEIFGGYPWYQDEERLMYNGFPWAQSVDYRATFLHPELAENLSASPAEYVNSRYQKAVNAIEILSDDEPVEKRIRQMFALNIGWFLQTLSNRNDSMSAAAGLSVRVPFLDYRLVEYLFNVPWKFKNHDNREKGLLRVALKGLLPEAVLFRKKCPFPKTHNPAYLGRVKSMLEDVLKDANSPVFSMVSRSTLAGLLNDCEKPNWYGQLMSYPQTIAYFLQINEWMKEFAVRVE